MRDFREQLPLRFSASDDAEAGLDVRKPTAVIKLYDAPATLRKADVTHLLGLHGVPSPMELVVGTDASGQTQGFLRFVQAAQAVDAMLSLNNAKVFPSGGDHTSPAHLKLTFADESVTASALGIVGSGDDAAAPAVTTAPAATGSEGGEQQGEGSADGAKAEAEAEAEAEAAGDGDGDGETKEAGDAQENTGDKGGDDEETPNVDDTMEVTA